MFSFLSRHKQMNFVLFDCSSLFYLQEFQNESSVTDQNKTVEYPIFSVLSPQSQRNNEISEHNLDIANSSRVCYQLKAFFSIIE